MDSYEKTMGYTKADRDKLVKERDQAVKLYTEMIEKYNFLLDRIARIGLDIQIFSKNIREGVKNG